MTLICKRCAQISYQNGVEISRCNEAEYCGSELTTILNTPDVTVMGVTTGWRVISGGGDA